MSAGYVREGVVVGGFEAAVIAQVLRSQPGNEALLAELNRFGDASEARARVLKAISWLDRAARAWFEERRAMEERNAETIPGEMGAGSEPMTTEQAADLLQVTERRIQQLGKAGLIGSKTGGRWVFTEEELVALRESREAA